MYTLIGVKCETKCPPGKFGPTCNQECNCKNNSSCDPESGKCFCARGWQGEDCSEPCDKGFYGLGCQQICPELLLGMLLNFYLKYYEIYYYCFLYIYFKGNKTCDHITGDYVCPDGYIGITCEHPCPIGTYGKNCRQNCSCKNGGGCHHVTGKLLY